MKLLKISSLKKNTLFRFLFYPFILARRIYFRQPKKYFCELLFSNVKEGSLVVTINDIPGSFEIDARSYILQRILSTKEFEEKTVRSIKKYININKDAVNIGANVGIFSVLMAQLISETQKVLSVEPTPLAFKYLKQNIERNGVSNKILLYNGICTDKAGTYDINTIIGKEEYSSIGNSIFMEDMTESIIKIQVPGETVDNLIAKFTLNPGLMVIDVEGAEMKVLHGAGKMLREFKPIILLELHGDILINQQSSSAEVIDFLNNLGYRITNLNVNRKIKHPFTGHILAFPSEE